MTGSPRQLTRRAAATLLRGLIRAYQLGPAYFFQGSCRYEPGCSRYATEAVAMHGPLKGGWLAVRRVCRCHPWGGLGYDPVPAPAARRASTGEPVGVIPGRLPTAPPRTPRALEF